MRTLVILSVRSTQRYTLVKSVEKVCSLESSHTRGFPIIKYSADAQTSQPVYLDSLAIYASSVHQLSALMKGMISPINVIPTSIYPMIWTG